MYDTKDNIVFQDFVIAFNGNYVPIKLYMSGFSNYRAQLPPQTPLGDIIPPLQLDINNVFEYRNVKRIVIQTQDSYDSNGRYAPYSTDGSILKIQGSRWTSIDPQHPLSFFARIMLDIDSIRFTKPLLATSGPVTDRDIEGDFVQRPSLILYDNLKNDVLTENAIRKFRHIEYDLDLTGKFDIKHGDSFYYLNPRLVPNRLADGTPTDTTDPNGHGAQPGGGGQQGFVDNTEKLVAKRIEYSWTKPSDAPGGFLRKIVGIKRFTGS